MNNDIGNDTINTEKYNINEYIKPQPLIINNKNEIEDSDISEQKGEVKLHQDLIINNDIKG